MKIKIRIVATYGSMSKSCAFINPWNLNPTPRKAPNAQAAKIALIGSHVQKITNATAIHPAPAVMLFYQRGTNTRERNAPPSPHKNPPARTCTYFTSETLIPDASAAPGFSPTARRFNPALV